MVGQPLRTTREEVSFRWTFFEELIFYMCLSPQRWRWTTRRWATETTQRCRTEVRGLSSMEQLTLTLPTGSGQQGLFQDFCFFAIIESSCFQLHQPWRSSDPSKPLKRRESQWTSGRGRWRVDHERQEQSHVWDGWREWRGKNVFENKKSASSLSVLS